MHLILLSSALAALLPLVLAAPLTSGTPITVTADQLEIISPPSKSCTPGVPYAIECQTAAQAAGPISTSFKIYGITTPGAAAAVIATIAFESGDFQYDTHHFPGPVPGQGTRNMQLAKFNLPYAQSIRGLESALPAANEAGPDAVLHLLTLYGDYDFGSAAWYLATLCAPEIMSGLAAGTTEAFDAYVVCYDGTPDPKRTAYFTAGLAVLGGKSS